MIRVVDKDNNEIVCYKYKDLHHRCMASVKVHLGKELEKQAQPLNWGKQS